MISKVSIIVPCYNEARTIGSLLEAIRSQSIPSERLEVIIADGGSTDGTREVIRQFAEDHPDLRVTIADNRMGTIPAALNTAIKAASGAVIVRLDAHSKPAPDYVERCLKTLERTGAANVGGAWQIEPSKSTAMARSIAAAAAHPLGAGGASYRVGGKEGPADTVPFGCFPREWLERVGSFREDLLTNEDYEYNVRIREAGGLVWFNPEISAIYYARATLRELLRQYVRYGFWKAQMLRLYPRSIRPRQVIPPLFVLSLMILVLLSAFWPLAGVVLAIEFSAYVGLLVLAGLLEAVRRRDAGLIVGFPQAVATMHLAWGAAFLWGLLSGTFTIVLRDRGSP